MPKIILGIAALMLSAPLAWAQPGTTVISHGYQIDAAFPQWLVTMGTAIANEPAPGAPIGTVLRHNPATGAWNQVFGSGDPAGEIILLFDWAESSAWSPGDNSRVGTADAAADVLYATMRDPNITGALSGVSVLESSPGVVRPLHFISHSRGTTVHTATVRRLIVAGFTVDHVTTLDPHPIGPSANLLDPDPITWEGVTFADNYWRADGCDFDFGCFFFDFDGEEIPGSLNVDLGLDAFGFVDNRLAPCTLEHLLVHGWYHGTIDLVAGSDGDCTISRGDWYTNGGNGEGFYYSRLGGGFGMRPCGPTGGCADAGRTSPAPTPTIANGDFGYGAGHDAGWRWHDGGGSGVIIAEPGNAHLRLSTAGASRTHNSFFVDDFVTTLEYSLRVSTADPAATLEVVLIDPITGAETTIESVPLPAITGWESRSATLSVPGGRAYRLSVRLSPTTSLAVIDLDDFTLGNGPPPSPQFRRGDCNADSLENLADAIFALEAIFAGGATPVCISACDMNDDGGFDISDPITILATLFSGGAPIPPPNPNCGVDPTPDGLGCIGVTGCP